MGGRHLAVILFVFALGLCGRGAGAVDYLSEAEALALAFGADAAVERLELKPDAAQAKTVLERSRSTARGKLGGAFVGRRDGKVLGVAYIDHVIGRTEFITWLCVIGGDRRIRTMAVMSYREPIGGEVNDAAWLRQFTGLGPDDQLRRGRPITPIAGATLSVDAICERARFLLDLQDVVVAPGLGPAADVPFARAEAIGTSALNLRIHGAADPGAAADAALAAARRAAAVLNQWDPSSELARLNAAGGGDLSDDLAAAFALVDRIHTASSGAFDPTIGPLILAWRDAADIGTAPSAETLAALRQRIGWQRVERDGNRVRLPEGMSLDFGALAKGAILDAAGAVLSQALPTACADLDLGTSARLVVGTGQVDVPLADPADPARILQVVALRAGQALAVSHSSGRRFRVDGREVSHLIDPRSGEALPLGRFAAVIAPSAAVADALATACCVLEGAAARRLIEAEPGAGALLAADGGLIPVGTWPVAKAD